MGWSCGKMGDKKLVKKEHMPGKWKGNGGDEDRN